MVSVCFVCLGNICRSPTAEGVMKHLVAEAGLTQHIFVDSAGTAGYHAGERSDARSREAARRRGIQLDHVARQFRRSDFERFDYVLAMDLNNLDDLGQLAGPGAASKLQLLRAYDPSAPANAAVPDPYYGGEQGFEDVLDMCERACRGLLAHIRKEHGI